MLFLTDTWHVRDVVPSVHDPQNLNPATLHPTYKRRVLRANTIFEESLLGSAACADGKTRTAALPQRVVLQRSPLEAPASKLGQRHFPSCLENVLRSEERLTALQTPREPLSDHHPRMQCEHPHQLYAGVTALTSFALLCAAPSVAAPPSRCELWLTACTPLWPPVSGSLPGAGFLRDERADSRAV